MSRLYRSSSEPFGLVFASTLAVVLFILCLHECQWAQAATSDGTVVSAQKISDTQGGFKGELEDLDYFGNSVSGIGDLDGDGVPDIAVGAPGDDDMGTDRGAVWILFLNSDGTVKSFQKISQLEGGLVGDLNDDDQFGNVVTSIGDFDGDGVTDLVVGLKTAVWMLMMNSDGTVKTSRVILDSIVGVPGIFESTALVGASVASMGDLDGDGVTDLAIGVGSDHDGGKYRGAVWILLMNADGSIKSPHKISDTAGGLRGSLYNYDRFGHSVARLGDFDGNGVSDLAVGAPHTNPLGMVWLLYLKSDGTLLNDRRIPFSSGETDEYFLPYEHFGSALVNLGDLDGDGITDLAVGTRVLEQADSLRKVGWIVFMNKDGTIKKGRSISNFPISEGWNWSLPESTLANVGDLNNDGLPELAVGISWDDDGGRLRGAVWILFLDESDSEPPAIKVPKDILTDATSEFGAVVTFLAPTATDNVGVTVGPTCSHLPSHTFPIGETKVTCTAGDAAGNVGRASFSIVVLNSSTE